MLNTLSARTEKYGITEDSRILNVLPLYHGDGLGQGPLLAFANGATWVRPCDFQQQNLPLILDSIYGRRVTHFIAVPVLLGIVLRLGDEYRDCFENDDFQMLVSAAAHLPEKLWRAFEAAFGVEIVNKYSLSECSTGLFSGPDQDSRCVGSLGRPHGCEIRIVDEDGIDVRVGEGGELWLRSKSLMDGYMNNPEATEACMHKGWLRTGDLVRQDEYGIVYLVGRIKEMISFAGHTLVPAELIEALEEHPDVAEATVLGVPVDEWGETPVAFVIRKPDGNVSAGDLTEHCRSRLSEYKVPREVVFVDDFIRSETGKVASTAMIEQYQARKLSLPDETDRRILTIAQTSFRSSETPGPEASPTSEPGWDSLAHMEMLLQIEKTFGIRFSTREIMMLETLGGVIDLVKSKRAG